MTMKVGAALTRLPRRVSDALAWLGGANLAILGRTPTTRGKFVQMGLVLLTTASIAVVSMTFFIRQEVKEPESMALLVGVFWGLVILNLDRFLVVSMGATRDMRRLILMAVPRLALAIVISLVVSTPITLRLFQSDIDNQLQTSHLAESAYLNGLTAKSGPAIQAKQLATEIGQQQAVLDGALPHLVTSPQLQRAQSLVNTLQPQVQRAKQDEIGAYEAWQCELYGDGTGCAGASRLAGNGPIAQAKQQTYEQDVSTFNSLNGQLQAALKDENQANASLKQAQAAALDRYQAQARAVLPGLQRQYEQDENEIAQTQASDQAVINQNSGTLAQLSALWSAGAGSLILTLAHLTVMALFFLIELLPVLVKVLLNMGALDAYEKVLKADEDKIADRVRLERLTERRDAERKSDEEQRTKDAAAKARIKVAEDKSEREQQLGIRANEYIAEKMEPILDAALQQWSAQVTARLDNAPGGSGTPHGSTAPAPAPAPAQGNDQVRQQGLGLKPPGSNI
jgi:hypothetical protein